MNIYDETINAWLERYYNSRTPAEMGHCLQSLVAVMRLKRAAENKAETANNAVQVQ